MAVVQIDNLAAADLSEVTPAVKHRCKQLQNRADMIDDCLAGAGLSIAAQPSEAAEEAVPPGGSLNVSGQLARPGVVALQ